jgi:MoaA/NifB/PqqE/SkfB family radical SAM enzyme
MKMKAIKVTKPFAYNRVFNPATGFMARWGATKEEDPPYSPIGPEILDLEISVNACSMGCKFCYKGNTNATPTNMSLATFKQIMDKMNANLDSVAFGITDLTANSDFIPMLRECRARKVVPNFTLSGIDLTDELAIEIAPLVGAVAVSVYAIDKNIAYNAIHKFLQYGVTQTNIHLFVSEETLPFVYEVLQDIQTDLRLVSLNAVVFLGVKPKGRAKGKFHSLDKDSFASLIDYCMKHDIPHGFDSCSAPKYVATVKEMLLEDEQKTRLIQAAESCESFGMFSAYINVHGEYFPCSFCEGEPGWETGMSTLDIDNFVDDIWKSERVQMWREKSLSSKDCNGCRKCLMFTEVNV